MNHYRSLLHKDSIFLLVLSIVFIIINAILGIFGNWDESIPVFLKSMMFAVFSIVLICNKKEEKKFIGNLSMILGCIMILTLIGDSSLFGVVYFLFGIFLVIHSVLYLKSFNDNAINQKTNLQDVVTKNSNIKYISLIPIILTIFLCILGIIFKTGFVGLSWPGILIFIINIISIILCVVLHHKGVKFTLMYTVLVISIMITLFDGLFIVSDIKDKIRENNYYDSEKFLVDYAKDVEKYIKEDVMQVKYYKKLNMNVSQVNIITLKDFLNIKRLSSLETLEKAGYSCDGYVVLEFKDTANIDDYYAILNSSYSDYDSVKDFFNVNPYISCSGKYSYTTAGYDYNKLFD